MEDIYMGNDAIKDAATNVSAVGAGIGTGVVAGTAAGVLNGKINKTILKSLGKEALTCNSVFKAPALKAFENENIFHTKIDEPIKYIAMWDGTVNETAQKMCKAFTMITGSYKEKDLASRINNKINEQTNKIFTKIASKMPELPEAKKQAPSFF